MECGIDIPKGTKEHIVENSIFKVNILKWHLTSKMVPFSIMQSNRAKSLKFGMGIKVGFPLGQGLHKNLLNLIL